MGKATEDPFPHLPRRAMFEVEEQRFPLIGLGAEAKPSAPSKSVEPMTAGAIQNAKAVLVDAEKKAARKRGRPIADKPWEREGVSRMTWYRNRKKGAA